MKKRIYGLETEFGFLGNDELVVGSLRRNKYLYRTFHSNGGRIYLDGKVPEYATPECCSVLDLVRYDKAGEIIIFEQILGGQTDLFKNNRGWRKASRGCHENYLAEATIIDIEQGLKKLADRLLPFLVTRQIFCGAGAIETVNHKPRFCLSQRARFITNISGGSTTEQRPVIQYKRDETAGNTNFIRLHLILGDSNLSEISAFLKVGTTGIVLRMIEDGFLPAGPKIKNPLRVFHLISYDPSCRLTFTLSDGQRMTAINIQEWYLEKAYRYFKRAAAPTQEEILILQLWQQTLDRLKKDPRLLDQEIDWLIKKYQLIDPFCQKKNLPLNYKQVRELDFLYHHLNPEISLYNYLLKQGKIKRLLTDEQIIQATKMPPRDTRAKLRGQLVDLVIKSPSVLWQYVDIRGWDQVGLWQPGKGMKQFKISPFATKHPAVDKFIKRRSYLLRRRPKNA